MCHFQVRSEEHRRGHKALLFLTMQTSKRYQSFKIGLEGKVIHGHRPVSPGSSCCAGYLLLVITPSHSDLKPSHFISQESEGQAFRPGTMETSLPHRSLPGLAQPGSLLQSCLRRLDRRGPDSCVSSQQLSGHPVAGTGAVLHVALGSPSSQSPQQESQNPHEATEGSQGQKNRSCQTFTSARAGPASSPPHFVG